MPEAVAPTAQVRRAASAIRMQDHGDFRETQACELGLHNQFRGKLHTGGVQFE